MVKICNTCQITKSVIDFHRRGNGYKSECKLCRNAKRPKRLKVWYSHCFCSSCQQSLPNTEASFRRPNYFRNNHRQCRTCENEVNRLRMARAYQKDPQQVLDRNHRWYQQNATSEKIKDWSYLQRYGLRLNDFEAMVDRQDRRCASCQDKLDMGQNTHVDHCHLTNKVRGVLCRSCNIALGFLRDDPVRIAGLLNYIGESNVK